MTTTTTNNSVRVPDQVGARIDPNSCEVMDGHQHAVQDIDELTQSISALGQLHHALVIEHADGRRFIAAGRRRWLACKALGCSLKADIWQCAEEDIDLELFARAVRIAENLQRSEPSSMDIALQLRATRNQLGFKNAKEVAACMKMGESTVKSYLSIFRASDHLQDMARQHALPLAHVLELAKCEKKLGVARTRKLIGSVCKGELTQKDLAKLRGKPERKAQASEKSSASSGRKPSLAKLRRSSKYIVQELADGSDESKQFVEALVAKLTELIRSKSAERANDEEVSETDLDEAA